MSKARREEINDISKRTLFLEKLQKQAQLFEGKEIQPLNEPLVEYGQDLPFQSQILHSPLYSIAPPLRFQYVISCSIKSHFNDLNITSIECPDLNENWKYSELLICTQVYLLSNSSLKRINSVGFPAFLLIKENPLLMQRIFLYRSKVIPFFNKSPYP